MAETQDRRPSAASSSASPHDPNRKPVTGSILNNPHEAPSLSEVKAKSSKRSAIKAAFIPVQPGKQIKTNGKPLGKSFERARPLPKDIKVEGGQVLDRDPRGEDASTGDGVVLTSSTSRDSDATSSYSPGSSSDFALDTSSETTGDNADSATSYESDDFDEASTASSSSQSRRARKRTDTMSTQDSSMSGSSHTPSIRFCPLPVSGRLKRANSITIGIAARSQMLRSQGPGRNANFPPQPAPQQLPHGMTWAEGHPGQQHQSQQPQPQQQQQQQQVASPPQSQARQPPGSQQQKQAAAAPPQQTWYTGGPKPADHIDLGEEITKRWKSAWKRMKSSGDGGSADVTSEKEGKGAPTPNGAAQNEAAARNSRASVEDTTGEQTPKRPASPSSEGTAAPDLAMSKMSLDDSREHKQPVPQHHETQGSHHDHFPPHQHLLDHGGEEGTRTPRQGVTRRLSTGAFLKNASLREMQEERRREVLGVEGGDQEADPDSEAAAAAGAGRSSSPVGMDVDEGGAASPARSHSGGPQQAKDEEGLVAGLKESLSGVGNATVWNRLSPWGSEGPTSAAANGVSVDDSALPQRRQGRDKEREEQQQRTDAPSKKSGARVVEPHRNPEEEEFQDADQDADDDEDEDEDGDDEEMREAEKLAQDSLGRSSGGGGGGDDGGGDGGQSGMNKMGRAAGVEVVH